MLLVLRKINTSGFTLINTSNKSNVRKVRECSPK